MQPPARGSAGKPGAPAKGACPGLLAEGAGIIRHQQDACATQKAHKGLSIHLAAQNDHPLQERLHRAAQLQQQENDRCNGDQHRIDRGVLLQKKLATAATMMPLRPYTPVL